MEREKKLAVVGLSGSGKTLTALALLGLLPEGTQVSGSVWYFDADQQPIDLLHCPPDRLAGIRGRHIAMMFQEPLTALNPVLTCGAQIAEAVRRHRNLSAQEANDLTLYLLHQVKLDEARRISKSYPHQLSGGQRQRILLAMALASSPELLVADEPTSSLDSVAQAEILDLINEMCDHYRMSLLFITHDLSVAAQLASGILVFDSGTVVESGIPQQLLQQPRHPATQRLVSCLKERRKQVSHPGAVLPHPTIGKGHSNANAAQPASPPVLLEVRNLSVTHYESGFVRRPAKTLAVYNVSFTIHEGESVGLAGVSGSGKTSLAWAILGLQDSVTGQIFFRGRPEDPLMPVRSGCPPRGIQLIFQDPFASLNPRLTIGSALEEAVSAGQPLLKGSACRQQVLRLLDQVQLPASCLARFPHEFSAGQRQRIALARALATRPRLLICDECVSSLDVCGQAAILQLLQHLRREHNLAYLFIAHDMNLMAGFCDRIMLMRNGELVEQNLTDRLFADPQTDYARQLLLSVRRWHTLPY